MSILEPHNKEVLVLPIWPSFEQDEIAAASSVLQSGKVNYWTGEEGRQFEKEFASFIGCKHAVAVANGTVSLELALRAIDVGLGDEVIVPSRSYFATASSVVAVGARPVFADVDLHTQNITAATIKAAATSRTKAVIVVHLAGWPCDMDSILRLTDELGLVVVEDCAQAHGATFRGQKVGSFGAVGSFSFCQDKIMTTAGEGGMVTTNSDELWERMWSYKDHGKSYAAVYGKQHAPGFRWLHERFGTNWRLTEVQSAVGRRQLTKLPDWLEARRHNASRLAESLSRCKALCVPQPPAHIEHAFYKLYAFVDQEELAEGWDRGRIAQTISGLGVPCTTGSCSEIYLESAFPKAWQPAERLPVAKKLGESSLMFQVHPTLREEHILRICGVIEQVMSQATECCNAALTTAARF